MHGRCDIAAEHAIDGSEREIPAVETGDDFAYDPGTQYFRIRLAKVCAFLTQRGSKSVDDDHVAHRAISIHKNSEEEITADAIRPDYPYRTTGLAFSMLFLRVLH